MNKLVVLNKKPKSQLNVKYPIQNNEKEKVESYTLTKLAEDTTEGTPRQLHRSKLYGGRGNRYDFTLPQSSSALST